jgi:GNAT superfamily N-acetyltransferase
VAFVIRRADMRDAETLARLRFEFRASLDVPAATIDDFLARAVPWMTARLGRVSNWYAWIAEHDAAAVGTVWLQLIEKLPNPGVEPEWHGYLSSLYVRGLARGRGIGSALLLAALDECDARGVDAIVLWPTPESRRLYTRHGFTVRDDVMSRADPTGISTTLSAPNTAPTPTG